MTIMNNQHPKWDEFMEKLSEQLDASGGCKTNLVSSATVLVKDYPECSLEYSLKYFVNKGGHCDCEVLMNVYRPLDEDLEEVINNALTTK